MYFIFNLSHFLFFYFFLSLVIISSRLVTLIVDTSRRVLRKHRPIRTDCSVNSNKFQPPVHIPYLNGGTALSALFI